jgi:hypothetical protein
MLRRGRWWSNVFYHWIFFFLRYFAAGFCLASIQFGFILLLVGSLFLRLFLYLYLFKLALYLIKLLNKILDVKKNKIICNKKNKLTLYKKNVLKQTNFE